MKKAKVLAVMVYVMSVMNIASADMVWVYINDPGVSGHEGFTGYMSKYETTNAQYCQFLNAALASGDITVDGNDVIGASGSNSGEDFVSQLYYDGDGPGWNPNGGAARINYSGGVFSVDNGFENHPVSYVSWYGATAFCNYYGYRLPTEWEWQAVADYDGSFTYGCGTSINNSIANYAGSTHPYDDTAVVGSFGTYGYGVCDLAGNVWEWTSSCYYSDCSYGYRVLRGGCFDLNENYSAVQYRHWPTPPDHANYTIGFRVASIHEPDPIQEILGFIEQSVADGTLVPVKEGKAGRGQLGALINMIEAAGNLIDANDPNLLADICGQLHAALGKTDGQDPPPDFVTGPAAPQLAAMIEEFMDSLGCE